MGDVGQIGEGEVHFILTPYGNFLMSGPELEEALRYEEEPDQRGRPPASQFCERFLAPLKLARARARLRLYLHSFRKKVKRDLSPADLEKGLTGVYWMEHRRVELGILDVNDSRIFVGGVELPEKVLKSWLQVCLDGFWKDPDMVTAEWATGLAKLMADHSAEAERRSLETLRSALGEEVTDQLLKRGEVTVRSVDGTEYLIKDSGEVFALLPEGGRRQVCVRVADEENLPKYDRVLAKYLAIRDHPEQISTLGQWRRHEIGQLEREIAMLEEQIAAAHERRAHLLRELCGLQRR